MSEQAQSAESVASPHEAITRAPLTAGNRADFDTPNPGLEGVLSLDRLVFTFDVVPALRETFRRQMHRVGFPRSGGRIYRESLEVDDPAGTGETILIQWAPYLVNSVAFARVEFNPAKVLAESEVLRRFVRPFLRRGWGNAHITRIDAAVDYGVSLQDHVYYAGNHKGTLHYSPDGIETVYLGSPQSDSRIRIYDKAKELALRGKPVPPYPLTRIEAQRRSTGLAAAHVDTLPNPFRRLKVARPVPAGLPFRYLLYFQDAEKHGIDSVLKRLGRCERKRFKEYLAQMPGTIEHPSLVFVQDYKPLCRKRLTLFFEKGGEDGTEAGSGEGLGAASADGRVGSDSPAVR